MKSEKGFTLIEMLAVLVILGIMAAIAVPRYLQVASEAKHSAARAEIAEIKSMLDQAYCKLYMSSGRAPESSSAVIAEAGFTSDVGADVGKAPDIWNVTLRANTTGRVIVEVNSRGNDNDFKASGTWNMPQY